MKFGPFRVPKDFDEVWGLVRNLAAGLSHLSLADNFDSFVATATIAAGGEESIRNGFRDGTIPTTWLVVDAVGGNQITRGATAWDSNYVSLANNGAAPATVTVRFFK